MFRSEKTVYLVRNRAVLDRNSDKLFLGMLNRLGDRFRNFSGLALADADPSLLVADDHQRGEIETLAALDDLRDPVDKDDLVFQIQFISIDLQISLAPCQNLSPRSRDASANAFTRP